MNIAICTLYEGHYHFGLAALVNSLEVNGFKGSIYIGYRGALPPWAVIAEPDPSLQWSEGKSLKLTSHLSLHFLPLSTKWHLTNYKPTFMLDLFKGPAAGAKGIFYFDPDITVLRSWDNFEDWISNQ